MIVKFIFLDCSSVAEIKQVFKEPDRMGKPQTSADHLEAENNIVMQD